MDFNLLTVKDCANLLKVSTITVRRLISNKEFCPIKKIGGQIRVKDIDLENWIDNQKTEKDIYLERKNKVFLNKLNKLRKGGTNDNKRLHL